MARTIDTIQQTIIDRIQSEPALAGLTSTSKTAIWRLLVYCISYGIFVLETIFDTHKEEVDQALLQQKTGTKLWYRNMLLAYQHGFELLPDSDQFDNTGYTTEQIEASKIIKYAAVTESDWESRLIMKIAGEDENGILSPIDSDKITAIQYYIDEFNYAGVKYNLINYAADRLKLNLTIRVDPKVIDVNGYKILPSANDVGTKPVEIAINEFMKELPFDGKLVLNALIDKLQNIPGVVDPIINSAETCWINSSSGGYGPFESIYGEALPVAGYFTWSIDNNDFKSVINYVV